MSKISITQNLKSEDLIMTILDLIRKDALGARKERRREAGLLVTLIGEIETRTKALKEPRPLTDEEVVGIVQKFLKNAEETLETVRGSRPQALDQIGLEILTLQGYLPSQMSEADLRVYAHRRIQSGDGLGQVMAALKANFPGQYDQNEWTQAPSKPLYWWGSPQGCPLSPGVTAPGHTP